MPRPLNLEHLTNQLREFAAKRQWLCFHTPKNLAMALSVEAGELLDHFTWLTPEESSAVVGNKHSAQEIASEIADVLIYLVRLADVLEIGLAEAVEAKLAVNARRFPPSPSGG